MMRLTVFAIIAMCVACTEEFKPPPKKEPPTLGKVAAPAELITVRDLIGRDTRKFGFETTPILGASAEEINKGYGSHMIGRTADGKTERLQFDGWMNVEGVPKTGRNLLVSLVWNEGRVYSYELLVRDRLEEELVEALAAARGVASGLLDREIGVWFGDNPATTLYVVDHALRLVVRAKSIKPKEAKLPYRGRKTPAQIIGAAPDRFAFEPVPLLGVVIDELASLSPRTNDDDDGRMVGKLTVRGALDLPSYYDASRDLRITYALGKKREITQLEFALPYLQGFVDAIVAVRGPAKKNDDDDTQVLAKGATFLRITPNWIKVRVGGAADAKGWLAGN